MSKAVVFDLDDTLYEELQYVYSGFRAVAVHLCSQYGLDEGRSLHRMQELLEESGRGRIFNVVLEENGLDDQLVPELVGVYRNHIPLLQLYPDAQSILSQLHGQAKLGLITDGAAEVQWNKIRALKLETIMDIIVVTGDYGAENWKPSPFPYRRVMEKLKVPPEDCVYIGDNPEKDFITAKQLGWRTIRVCRPGSMCWGIHKDADYEAHFNVFSLMEVPPLLKA